MDRHRPRTGVSLPTAEIHRCHCLTLLSKLPDESIDSFVSDPPYGINLKLRWNRDAGLSIKGDRAHQARQLWADFLPQAARIAKPNTAHLFFGTWKSIWIKDLLEKHFAVKGCIVWKKNTWGLGWYLRPRWELIWLVHKGTPPIPDPAPPDVWEHARDHRLKHPCQKPIELLRRAVAFTCPPGGTVCDPFAGIFSTAVAALLEGRNFIGSEIDARYCTLGRRRVAQTLRELASEVAPVPTRRRASQRAARFSGSCRQRGFEAA
jgi:adenine-specific DNA-methyltransferase